MHCAVYPQLGAGQVEGYIDAQVDIVDRDPHVYVSVVAVREMCKFLGWPTKEDHEETQRALEAALVQVQDLQEQLKALERFKDNAEYTLAVFGKKVQGKPGRPKKEESNA